MIKVVRDLVLYCAFVLLVVTIAGPCRRFHLGLRTKYPNIFAFSKSGKCGWSEPMNEANTPVHSMRLNRCSRRRKIWLMPQRNVKSCAKSCR